MATKFKAEGALIMKGAIEVKTEKFSVREFAICDSSDAQYPQYLKFQLSNANCNLIDTLKKDDIVEVEFNLQGRKFEKDGKTSYFNTLSAWKVKLVSAVTAQTTPPTTVSTKEDLPF